MPPVDRRALLKYTALTATGLVGLGLLRDITTSRNEEPSWDPPVEGSGDWAIIDQVTDRFTAQDVDGTLLLTVQGPNDGSDRFYNGGPGLRFVSYEATISDANQEWNYTFGQPHLTLRFTRKEADEEAVYFSNADVYGNTPSEGRVSGRTEIRHTFNAGSGRGAVSAQLNHSPSTDSDETEVDATMESSIRVPVRKVWMRENGGRIEAGTVQGEITETVSFIQ